MAKKCTDIREHDGVFYLYTKTTETADRYKKIELPTNYEKAIELIDKHLMYKPRLIVQKTKQRLTTMTKMRMQKLNLETREKVIPFPKKAIKGMPTKTFRLPRPKQKAEPLHRAVHKEMEALVRAGKYDGMDDIPNKKFLEILYAKSLEVEDNEEEKEPVEGYILGYNRFVLEHCTCPRATSWLSREKVIPLPKKAIKGMPTKTLHIPRGKQKARKTEPLQWFVQKEMEALVRAGKYDGIHDIPFEKYLEILYAKSLEVEYNEEEEEEPVEGYFKGYDRLEDEHCTCRLGKSLLSGEKAIPFPRKEIKGMPTETCLRARRKQKAKKAEPLQRAVQKELVELVHGGKYDGIDEIPTQKYQEILDAKNLEVEDDEEEAEEPEIGYFEGYDGLEEEDDIEDFANFSVDPPEDHDEEFEAKEKKGKRRSDSGRGKVETKKSKKRRVMG